MKRGKLNAFKFLNLILVNHLTSRWFEVKFNFALVESTRKETYPPESEGRSRICFLLHNSFNYSGARVSARLMFGWYGLQVSLLCCMKWQNNTLAVNSIYSRLCSTFQTLISFGLTLSLFPICYL